ncbi:MAG: LIC_13355 family lipoprotein [Leptospira sp.]|nr:LIC_13355 family lipoprotein [Leptospira sp.]
MKKVKPKKSSLEKKIPLFLGFLFFLTTGCNEPKQNNWETLLPLLATGSGTQRTCPPNNIPSNINLAKSIIGGTVSNVSGFNDRNKAINGICGEGEFAGSLDVYALDKTGAGSSITLSFEGTVKNVAGIDFIVYENPFRNSGSTDRYAMDPAVVEVSQDNVTYCGFTLNHDPTPATLNKLTSWSGFAGVHPVHYNMVTNPFTLEQLFTVTSGTFLLGGGDGFDLANLTASGACNGALVTNIQTNGFVYVKITSASERGYTYPHEFNNGSDVDGVVARRLE